jgi:hypothetical protein
MPGYYTERLAAEPLRTCYNLAPPRTKAYLKEGSNPIRNGIRRRDVRNRGSRTILQQSRSIGFEHGRTGGLTGIVVDNDRLILEVTHEFVSFLPGRKFTLVSP